MAAGVVLSASYPQLLNANRSATAQFNNNNGTRTEAKQTTVNTNRGTTSPNETKSTGSSSSESYQSPCPSSLSSPSNVGLSDVRSSFDSSSSSSSSSSCISIPRGRVPLSSVVNCLVGKWSEEYLSSAKAGDLDSMCLVAQMYLGTKGWGRIQPNEVEGKKWIEKAKEATHKARDLAAEKTVTKLEETLCPIQRTRAISSGNNTSGSNTSGNESPLHQPRAIHSNNQMPFGVSSLPPPLLIRTPSPSLLSIGNMSNIDDSNFVSDRSGYATSEGSTCPTPIARTPSAAGTAGTSTPRMLNSIGNGLRSSFSSVLSLLTSPLATNQATNPNTANNTTTKSRGISRSASTNFHFSSTSSNSNSTETNANGRENQSITEDVEPTSAPIHPRATTTSVAAPSAAAPVLAPSTHTLHHHTRINSTNASPQSRLHLPQSHTPHHPLHLHSSHADYQEHDYSIPQSLSHSHPNPHPHANLTSHPHISGLSSSSRVGAGVPSSRCISHSSGYSSSSANSMGSGSGVSSGDEGGIGLGSGLSAPSSASKIQSRSRSPSPVMGSKPHANTRDQSSPSFIPSQTDSMMPLPMPIPEQGNPSGSHHPFRHHQQPHVFAS